MHINIDADSLVYGAGFSTQGEPVENCLYLLKRSLYSILRHTEADGFTVYLTGTGKTFRHQMYTEYKANRTAPKPEHYKEAREYLIKVWGAEVTDYLEADDAVAIAQNSESILCSIDKDLLMIPGCHYNWREPDLGVFFVPEHEATEWFYTQLLMGDSTDNIKGLPYCTDEVIEAFSLHHTASKGCGWASATRILDGAEDENEMYARALWCYNKYAEETGGVGYDLLTYNANLVWIIRDLTETGEPVYWTPPEEA